MLCISIWKFLSFYEAVAWNIFLRLFAIFTWITWNLVSFFILEWCLNFFVDVLDVAIWKFLSLYEAVTWDIFLRLFAIFCWIVWNFISVFILVTCLNFLINVLCITVWKFLSFYEAVTWDIFLRICTFFSSCSWNYITIFIFISCRNFFIDVFCISFFVYFSFNNLVSWDIFSWFSSIFCWWKWFTIFINERSIRTNCWSVSSCYRCSVLIYTFNCHTFSFSYEVRFWCERYFTVFIDCVCSFAWYFLLSCAIVKCWFNSFIDWYIRVSWFKFRCSCLWLPFRSFRFCRCSFWSHWSYCWCVFSCHWCAILIYTFNSYACSFTCECLLWCERYCTVWIYFVSSFAWNCLSCWSIFEGCWYFVIHRYIWISWFEFRFASLFFTLDICCFSWFCCWGYRGYVWCVCCWNWRSIYVYTLDCNSFCFSYELWFWTEFYYSVIYCVSSFARYHDFISYFTCWWID